MSATPATPAGLVGFLSPRDTTATADPPPSTAWVASVVAARARRSRLRPTRRSLLAAFDAVAEPHPPTPVAS